MSIQSVLVSAAAKKIDFNLQGVRVIGTDFGVVAGKITAKRVRIKHKVDPAAGGFASLYNPKTRTIRIFSPNANFPSNSWEESLVLHEAAHAAGHVRRRAVSALNEEMAAHTAQAMYLIITSGRSGADVVRRMGPDSYKAIIDKCGKRREDCEDARLAAATLVAASLLAGVAPAEGALKNLAMALRKDPVYTKVLSRPVGFDRYEAP